jgi:hypothetical protein
VPLQSTLVKESPVLKNFIVPSARLFVRNSCRNDHTGKA